MSLWYYASQGQRFGPVSDEQLKELASSRQVLPSDSVWKDGMENWIPANSVKGLFPVAAPSVVPSPPPTSSPATVPNGDAVSKGSKGLAQAFSGLKAAKDMIAQKANEVKLNHQLNALKCLIGKEAHALGIDCGDCNRKAAEVLAHYQQVYQSAEAASASLKQAKDIKEKTIATKNIATTKAMQKKVEMDVNAAYLAVGAFVLANNLQVPNFEAQLAQAHELEKQVHGLHESVASTGKGLLKNKFGLVAVACVLMLICGVVWTMMGKIFDGRTTITASQLCDEYVANESRADATYKGRVIRVVGVSKADGKREGGICYEILEGSSRYTTVECLFEDEAEKDKVESAGNGISVIIEGRCDKFYKLQVGERVGEVPPASEEDNKWGRVDTTGRMNKMPIIQHDNYTVQLGKCRYCGVADKRLLGNNQGSEDNAESSIGKDADSGR